MGYNMVFAGCEENITLEYNSTGQLFASFPGCILGVCLGLRVAVGVTWCNTQPQYVFGFLCICLLTTRSNLQQQEVCGHKEHGFLQPSKVDTLAGTETRKEHKNSKESWTATPGQHCKCKAAQFLESEN